MCWRNCAENDGVHVFYAGARTNLLQQAIAGGTIVRRRLRSTIASSQAQAQKDEPLVQKLRMKTKTSSPL